MTETTIPDIPNYVLKPTASPESGTVITAAQEKGVTQIYRHSNVTELIRTSEVIEKKQPNTVESQFSSVERIYPHLFGKEGPAGEVRIFIQQALKDTHLALESFGEADLATVGTRLALIAVTMGKAHSVSEFNQSLGAVISFIRRAALTASGVDISRSMLNTLIHVLVSLDSNPMLDLEEAGNLVDHLSNEGWRGEYGFVNALVTALFDDEPEHQLPLQERLFDETPTEAK